jgi:hypothetical protein
MILSIECEVDSDTLLDEVIEHKFHPYLIKLYPNELHKLYLVSIERPFPNYEKYLPTIKHPPGELGQIKLPVGDFFPEQIEVLQYLESFSALDLGVRKIHWENPHIKWIGEDETERALIQINSYRYNETYPANKRKLTKKWLQDVIIHRNMVKHLKEPLSFYRLGANFYFEKLYILSFLNFFLMLEGVFGVGNTDKKHTIAAFMAAPNLKYGIEQTLETIGQPKHLKFREWFDNFNFNNPVIDDDPLRKMINILYDQRGLLAHNFITGYRKRTNFDQETYHPLAFIAMSICHFCAIKLRLDPFRPK